jgi:flap endonuclease-1
LEVPWNEAVFIKAKMGIKGLAKLLSDEAPDCIREVELKSLHGRKIAIDASMAIYQFLIAVRSGGPNQQATMLTNAEGETTSHIQGMFNRTIRYMTEGIRPVFVFDGKPPDVKSHELIKRREKREKAQAALAVASEEGNVEEQDKQSKRLVRAGTKENEDCRKLLTLMGVPVVTAPCEAEAQAAALCKAGLVYATGTEDMDALTFATPILVRKLTFANASKSMVQTMNYNKVIEGLAISHDQFVDLCIMLGCDYCDTIRGVGPKTALKLIREHGNIEKVIETIDRKKFVVPESWVPNEKKLDAQSDDDDEEGVESPSKEENNGIVDTEELIPAYVQARKLFNEHEVLNDIELKWKPCQAEDLQKFLVDDMGFNVDRVKNNIEKLQTAYKANSKPQTRMDSFFAVKANPNAAKSAAKRKADAAKAKAAVSKKKTKKH